MRGFLSRQLTLRLVHTGPLCLVCQWSWARRHPAGLLLQVLWSAPLGALLAHVALRVLFGSRCCVPRRLLLCTSAATYEGVLILTLTSRDFARRRHRAAVSGVGCEWVLLGMELRAPRAVQAPATELHAQPHCDLWVGAHSAHREHKVGCGLGACFHPGYLVSHPPPSIISGTEGLLCLLVAWPVFFTMLFSFFFWFWKLNEQRPRC